MRNIKLYTRVIDSGMNIIHLKFDSKLYQNDELRRITTFTRQIIIVIHGMNFFRRRTQKIFDKIKKNVQSLLL